MTATQTITIRGREYRVEFVPGDPNGATDLTRLPKYLLHGKRNACYGTLRTHNGPGMFLTNMRSWTANSMIEGVWLSDADGTLRVTHQ